MCSSFALILVGITILTTLSSCNSADKNIRRAEAAWAIGEYEEAANQYKKAYSRTPASERELRGKLSFLMAECYRHYGYSARALGSYRAAERYKYTDTTTVLRKGQMHLLQGEYKQAQTSFENYLAHLEEADTLPDNLRDPKIETYKAMANNGIWSCETAPAAKTKGSAYTVKMASQFNSNRSDFCPALLGKLEDKDVQLFFTSNRNAATGNELSGITGQKPCDIFVAKKDEKGKWKAVEKLEGGPNTEYDEGAPSFSPDGKTMYLTVCTTNPEYPRMAEIYTCSRSDAAWGKPTALKITADTLSSYAHPAVSPDGKWLYFTSDMPGGYGGTDIWRASFSGSKVGFIENLGPEINTSENESFPAFRPTGELYFSSDGRGGMGGLDLYRATEDSVTHSWSVHHLPAPMNSNGDDFGITFNGLHNSGFFSSSRSTGGRGWDKIYEFSYPEVLQSVKGYVYEQDGYELPQAQVYMVGSNGTNQKLIVKSDGTFEQPVDPGVDYLFLATCKGYLNIPATLHVDSLEEEHVYELDFPLPSLSLPVLVKNVFFAFNKAEITPESSTALDNLAKLLIENPNITIELASHCDYRGADEYNLNLSQRRAESVTTYLEEHGVDKERLTPKGYGETQPKIVTGKLAETLPFLHVGDTLSEKFILSVDTLTKKPRFTEEQQSLCNALNRRTEFRVLRTTYGLFDEEGNINVNAPIANPSNLYDDYDDYDETSASYEDDDAEYDEGPTSSASETDEEMVDEGPSKTTDETDDIIEDAPSKKNNIEDEIIEDAPISNKIEDDEIIVEDAPSKSSNVDDESEYIE